MKNMTEKIILLILFISTNLFYSFVEAHSCQYRMPHVNELVHGIELEPLPSNDRSKRDTSSNLRIYFDYQDSITSSSQFQTLKTSILEPARDQLQLLLQGKAPTSGVLLVNRACSDGSFRRNRNGVIGCAQSCTQTTCLNFVVPDKYLKQCLVVDSNGNAIYSDNQGSGVMNYDIVLLVTYTSCGGDTLAYANSCFLENTLDRPILGVVNLCSDKIQANVRVNENIKIVMHEIIHALGFGKDKYAFYRYQNGTPIVPRNDFGLPNTGVTSYGFYNWNEAIIKIVNRSRSSVSQSYTKSFYGFVLPNVLKAAQDHFNCPSLEAVDLEEYGDIAGGSALSHFDEYFLNNELMTPVTNNEIDFLSKMTLALLQDTGWYTVNMNAVGNLDYGYNQGCTLPQQGCYNFMKSQSSSSIYPFCNDPYQNGKKYNCPLFNNNACKCGLTKYSFVLSQNQYFTSLSGVSDSDVKYYYGMSPYNEYCPVYISDISSKVKIFRNNIYIIPSLSIISLYNYLEYK